MRQSDRGSKALSKARWCGKLFSSCPSPWSHYLFSTDIQPVLCSTTWWNLSFIISGSLCMFLHGLKGSKLSVVHPYFPWLLHCPAMEHWSEADTWIFEFPISLFCIEMLLLNDFLYKISRITVFPCSGEAGGPRAGREGFKSADEPVELGCWPSEAFGVPWPSRASGGMNTGRRWTPGSMVLGEGFLPRHICGNLLYSGYRRTGIWLLFMLREHIYGCCQWGTSYNRLLFG